jgi:protein O-mannosyl-transferase
MKGGRTRNRKLWRSWRGCQFSNLSDGLQFWKIHLRGVITLFLGALGVAAFTLLAVYLGSGLNRLASAAKESAASTERNDDSVLALTEWSLRFRDGLWTPISRLSLVLELGIHGANHDYFRVANLALHAVTVCLLFFALCEAAGSRLLAAYAAGLFAVHPVAIGVLQGLPGRGDLLGACFGLSAVVAFLRFARDGSGLSASTSVLCSVFAALSTPTLITLPLLFPLMDALAHRQVATREVSDCGPKPPLRPLCHWRRWYVAATALVFTVAVCGQVHAANASSVPFSFPNHGLALIPIRCATHIVRAIAPHWQPPEILSGLAAVFVIGATLLSLVAASTFAVAKMRRYPLICAAWLSFVVAALTEIGLGELNGQSGTLGAGYIPLIALVIVGVCLISNTIPSPQVRATALTLIALFNLEIFARMALVDYGQYRARSSNFAPEFARLNADSTRNTFLNGEKTCSHTQWLDGMLIVDSALQQPSEEAIVHCEVARALKAMNRPKSAADHYRRAIALDDDNFAAYYNLGIILLGENQRADAERHFWRAADIDPTQAISYVGLGKIYEQRGETFEAIEYLKRATELNPVYARRGTPDTEKIYPAEFLGDVIYRLQKRMDETPNGCDAGLTLEKILRANPGADRSALH